MWLDLRSLKYTETAWNRHAEPCPCDEHHFVMSHDIPVCIAKSHRVPIWNPRVDTNVNEDKVHWDHLEKMRNIYIYIYIYMYSLELNNVSHLPQLRVTLNGERLEVRHGELSFQEILRVG